MHWRCAPGIHQAKGELDAARALLRDLEPAPGDWRSLRVLSRQLLLDGDAMGAAELLRTALGNEAELGSRRGVVRRWLGDAYRLAGNAAEATAVYELALTHLSEDFRQQENPLALAEQTIVNARMGRRTVAQETVELCKAIAARGPPPVGDRLHARPGAGRARDGQTRRCGSTHP